jgi:hypothetical protein
MKRLQKLILTLLGITLLAACDSTHQQSDINLNNGEKWKVNAEMKPHIQKGNELLTEFISNKEKDYKKLAENLKTQNNSLIQSCTMKGESHDQLHKWLHPHIELTEKLSTAQSSSEAEDIISQLEKSFNTYQNYFD